MFSNLYRLGCLLLSIFGVSACSQNSPEELSYVDVVLYINEQWPSESELGIRNSIVDELEEMNFGDWVESGSGMGTVQFTFLTDRPVETAKIIIAEAIEKHAPESEFEISYSKYEKESWSEENQKALFEQGTCLSTKLLPGGYGAAIVLDAQSGFTLIGGLKGVYAASPTVADCERKEWLFLTHHAHNNSVHIVWCENSEFEEHAELFSVVGKVSLGSTDPSAELWGIGVPHGSWRVIENQIWLQDNWDKGVR